ncbi:MAG: hypothetical protein J6Y74_02125 [Clostridia bacterium]|nr:hypothetical protein [Clostridia bacterium]
MMRKEGKRVDRKVALIGMTLLLICAMVLVFTACSLFTSAFGVDFGKGSQYASTSEGESSSSEPSSDGGSSSSSSSSSSSQGGGSSSSLPSKVEDLEEGGGSTDAPIEEPKVDEPDPVSANVTISSSLIYDKTEAGDFIIDATHTGKTFYGVMGAGLKESDWSVRSQTTGASSVLFREAYMQSLAVGSYDFSYSVRSASGTYYDTFAFVVTNSDPRPSDLKIDYDVDFPNVYVTWHCDCNNKHTVKIDDDTQTVDAGVRSVRWGSWSSAVKKNVHYAQVKCVGREPIEMVTKVQPLSSTYEYLTSTISFMGKVADRYIEDFDEMVFAFQSIVYEGSDTSLSVALAADVKNSLNSNEALNEYLQKVNDELVIPWNLNVGMALSDNIATIRVSDVAGGNGISSGYREETAYSSANVASHYPAASSARHFAIDGDSVKETNVRNVKELLAAVEAGYRPTSSNAEVTALYNKARAICSLYITDEMSEVEKLHVIYDYLAGEIVYDKSALALYNMIAEIKTAFGTATGYSIDACPAETDCLLSDAWKTSIENKLSEASAPFSTEMKTAVRTAMDGETSMKRFYKAVNTDYLQKLKSFSLEGVLDDKTAVCEGISYAFMLLARIEGIECYQISGDAVNNGSHVAHAWNKVVLADGKCYCIDATWGNVTLNETRFVTHRYFLLDEASFCATHQEEVDSEACVERLATGSYDYYAHESTSFGHTLSVSNDSEFTHALQYYHNAGSNYIEVRFVSGYSPDNIQFTVRAVYGSYSSLYSMSLENGVYCAFVKQ